MDVHPKAYDALNFTLGVEKIKLLQIRLHNNAL